MKLSTKFDTRVFSWIRQHDYRNYICNKQNLTNVIQRWYRTRIVRSTRHRISICVISTWIFQNCLWICKSTCRTTDSPVIVSQTTRRTHPRHYSILTKLYSLQRPALLTSYKKERCVTKLKHSEFYIWWVQSSKFNRN